MIIRLWGIYGRKGKRENIEVETQRKKGEDKENRKGTRRETCEQRKGKERRKDNNGRERHKKGEKKERKIMRKRD